MIDFTQISEYFAFSAMALGAFTGSILGFLFIRCINA